MNEYWDRRREKERKEKLDVKPEGCGIYVAREGQTLIHCGDELRGKVRYCASCSEAKSKANEVEE